MIFSPRRHATQEAGEEVFGEPRASGTRTAFVRWRYKSRRTDRLPRPKCHDSPAVACRVRVCPGFPTALRSTTVLLTTCCRFAGPVVSASVHSIDASTWSQRDPCRPSSKQIQLMFLTHTASWVPTECPLHAIIHQSRHCHQTSRSCLSTMGWNTLSHSLEPLTSELEDGQRSSVQLIETKALANDVHHRSRLVTDIKFFVPFPIRIPPPHISMLARGQ